MRCLLVLSIGLLLCAQMSCFRNSRWNQKRWLTGTCTGACDYYAHCKERRGEDISQEVHDACTIECDDVFSSSETILAFESLVCEDAIAFVEGTSGRPPGQPMQSAQPPKTSRGADRMPLTPSRE